MIIQVGGGARQESNAYISALFLKKRHNNMKIDTRAKWHQNLTWLNVKSLKMVTLKAAQ